MSARKRSALPPSNPHYILSLLEENSSDESDSDLYSDSDDEELSPSPASPNGSFQSQNNSPECLLDPSSSLQGSLPSSTQGTSSFQSLPEIATFSSASTAYFSSSQSSITRSSLQLSPSITSSLHSSYLNTSPISPLRLPPPVFLNTSNNIAGSAIQGTSAPSFAVATTSSMTHYGL